MQCECALPAITIVALWRPVHLGHTVYIKSICLNNINNNNILKKSDD